MNLGVNIKLIVEEDENVEDAIAAFTRSVKQSGHLRTLRTKQAHESKQDKLKRKLTQSRMTAKFERLRDRYERKEMGRAY
jgi:ribosomal protein S21